MALPTYLYALGVNAHETKEAEAEGVAVRFQLGNKKSFDFVVQYLSERTKKIIHMPASFLYASRRVSPYVLDHWPRAWG